VDEKLETDHFHPSDVTSFSFPAGEEAPSSPAVTNGDCNSDTRAHIRESLGVNKLLWAWDLFGENWEVEDSGPPL